MKTIFFLMLFASSVFGQTVDTATFSIVTGEGGYYTSLMNKSDYMGVPAGTGRFAIQFDAASIDTSSWQFVTGYGGYYMFVTNRAEWYGIPAGTVRAQVVSGITNIGRDTTTSGEVTVSTLKGAIRTDNLNGNEYATITINHPQISSSSLVFLTFFHREFGMVGGYCLVQFLSAGSVSAAVGISSGTFSEEGWIFYEINP